MRKYIIILIVLILLSGGAAYYLLSSNPSAPIAQTLQNVLPFGSGAGQSFPATSGTETTQQFVVGSTTPQKLFEISSDPVAGAVAFINNGSLDVRYVDRATGHIYDVDPSTLQKNEIINDTVTKVYQALFKPDGSRVIFRTLQGESIQSVSYNIIAPKASSTGIYVTRSAPLRSDINEITAGINDIFYTIKGQPTILMALFDGTKAATQFTGAFNQWRLSAAGDRALLITSKASATLPGYSYLINTSNQSLRKIVGPVYGLTAIINSMGSRIAYSENNNGQTILHSINLIDGKIKVITPATLSDKCVWGSKYPTVLYCASPTQTIGTNEPDSWYQGDTHFTDRLWVINTDTNYSALIADPQKDFHQNIDAENLFLSPDQDYLFFTNRTDLSLWGLRLR